MSKKIAEIISIPDPLKNSQKRIQFSFKYWCENGEHGRKSVKKKKQKSEYDAMIKKLEEYADFDIRVVVFVQKNLHEITKKDKFPSAESEPKLTRDFLDNSKKYKLRISNKSRVGGYLNETDNVFYIRWFAPHHD